MNPSAKSVAQFDAQAHGPRLICLWGADAERDLSARASGEWSMITRRKVRSYRATDDLELILVAKGSFSI